MSSKSRQNSRMKSKPGTTCTDAVLLDVFNSLLTDLNRDLNTDHFNQWRCKSIKEYRKLVFPSYLHLENTKLVKGLHQITKFFSRYTAEDDAITPDVREANTFNAYYEDNIRVSTLVNLDTVYTNRVLGLARRKARKILGKFDKAVMFDNVRFGRRAAIGIPYMQSYLDCKMEYPLSCDPLLCKLFEEYLCTDEVLQDALQTGIQPFKGTVTSASRMKAYDVDVTHTPHYEYARSVKLSLVPKKFDKLRPVTPYSTVSILLSLAIGDYMSDCLKNNGLNLSRLQEKHREMMFWMSAWDGKGYEYATGDLHAASNSITWLLVRRVVPSDWYNILKKFQVKTIKYCPQGGKKKDTRSFHTETFLGMGSGVTFPLQTLIFYCIVDAIRELSLGNRGFVSVYGDDLIYPSSIQEKVVRVFSDLRLILNPDKSYAHGPFRESCGEDCHKGVSVRPWCLEGSTEQLKGAALGAFLFKTLNGLSSRWAPSKIPTTIHTINRWISASYGSYHIVPPGYPDYSGAKSSTPHNYEEWYVPVTVPYWRSDRDKCWLGSYSAGMPPINSIDIGWRFTCIIAYSGDRYVENTYPYLWDWLRKESKSRRVPQPFEDPVDTANLRWVTIKNVYRRIKGRKVRKLHPVVSQKGSTRSKLAAGLVFDWVTVERK